MNETRTGDRGDGPEDDSRFDKARDYVNEKYDAASGAARDAYNQVREKVEDVDGRPVASVVSAVCQGCGLCVAACTTGAMTLEGFTSEQLIAEVESLCRL